MNAIFISIVLSGLLSLSNGSLFETNFIGMDKAEITATVNEKHRAFKLNTAYVNKAYNYLKFEDSIREITVLFFLNDDDKCHMIRIMSDYSNINDIVEELNSYYTSTEKNCWKYDEDDKNYFVNLEEGDWFFTVSIKTEK